MFRVTPRALATWLGMTHTNTLWLLTALLSTASCTTSTPPPDKIFDFSSRPLTGHAPAPTSARSLKAQMRRAIDQLQPRLARCTTGTSGYLDITLRIELSPDQPPVLDGVEVTYPDRTAVACVRDALATIDLSAIEERESAVWVMHMPFDVAAYSAQQ